MTFQVGDIVTGMPDAPYTFTTSEAEMRVTAIRTTTSERYIWVKILRHKRFPEFIGREYTVKAKHFELVNVSPEVMEERRLTRQYDMEEE